MSGEKLEQAREAAVAAVQMLGSEDIVSVVAYDDSADVIVPATKLTDKQSVINKIRAIQPGGNTALFSGVSRGAAEITKFREPSRVNRVVLLSDGLANVGPSSPGELGDLGASLQRDGISVSTIGLGLGYNEDLMANLARRSDGNHRFAERATDLAQLFRAEFDGVLSVVAQSVLVTIECPAGVKPIRSIGRDAEIFGQRVVAKLNQVYADQEAYILLEAEVSPGKAGESRTFADASISYFDPRSRQNRSERKSGQITFTTSRSEVDGSIQRDTISDYYTQLSNAENEEAIKLADAGKKSEAVAIISRNAASNEKRARELQLPKLGAVAGSMADQAAALEGESYDKARKVLRFETNKLKQQQK
jgi:Ca-activated chloride channel family protein